MYHEVNYDDLLSTLCYCQWYCVSNIIIYYDNDYHDNDDDYDENNNGDNIKEQESDDDKDDDDDDDYVSERNEKDVDDHTMMTFGSVKLTHCDQNNWKTPTLLAV